MTDIETVDDEQDGMEIMYADQAESAYSRALDHLIGVQASRIALGLDLILIEDFRYWEVYGFTSFSEWCAAPPHSGGMGLTPRSRQTTMQVARRFVVELESKVGDLVKIPFSNLQTMVPVVTRENIKEVLSDALTLGNRDIRRNRDDGKYDGRESALDAEREQGPEIIEHHIRCPHCRKEVILSSTGSGKNISVGVALKVQGDENRREAQE